MLNNYPTARGNQLSVADQQHVLAGFIYRHTIENNARNPVAVAAAGGTLPLISDVEWLRISEFAVTRWGRLDARIGECYTHTHEVPAWKAIIDAWAGRPVVAAPEPAKREPRYRVLLMGDGDPYICKDDEFYLMVVKGGEAAAIELAATLNGGAL